MDSTEYHALKARPDVVTYSKLKDFNTNPARFHKGGPRKRTAALDWGSLFDHFQFTPELPLPLDTFAIVKTKGACAEKAHPGKCLAYPREVEEAERDAAIARQHPIFRSQPAPILQPKFVGMIAHGLTATAMFDFLPHRDSDWGEWIVDGKTTSQTYSSVEDYGRDVHKFGYHGQAAWYLDIYNAILGNRQGDVRTRFGHLLTPRGYPEESVLVELDPDAIEAGRAAISHWVERYAECLRTDVWPPAIRDGEVVSLPRWAK